MPSSASSSVVLDQVSAGRGSAIGVESGSSTRDPHRVIGPPAPENDDLRSRWESGVEWATRLVHQLLNYETGQRRRTRSRDCGEGWGQVSTGVAAAHQGVTILHVLQRSHLPLSFNSGQWTPVQFHELLRDLRALSADSTSTSA